ncbi:Uncharacterised protein [uncultured archaeon]|nr:Uncharacterised protein [uncultured archaeon]
MSGEDEYNEYGDALEGSLLGRTFKRWTAKIKEINEKYSQPRLKMTPLVKVSLLVLRLYLIMLVVILVYKFYTVVSFR